MSISLPKIQPRNLPNNGLQGFSALESPGDRAQQRFDPFEIFLGHRTVMLRPIHDETQSPSGKFMKDNNTG